MRERAVTHRLPRANGLKNTQKPVIEVRTETTTVYQKKACLLWADGLMSYCPLSPAEPSSEEEEEEEECAKGDLPLVWTTEKVQRADEEKIDVEMLDRDTPPDTPDDQIMDFSKKVEMKDAETWGVPPSPQLAHRGLGQTYLPEQLQSAPGTLPLHLHGLYGHREGLVSSYPLYHQSRPLQPSYQFLSPYHYPRLLLPSCSPPFPGMLPSRGALQYGGYLSADRLPYPPMVPPTLLPMSIPYAQSTHGGLKEQTPNVSPPRGSPATPEMSPPAKPGSHLLTPEPSPSGCDEAMNLSVAKSSTAPRNGPGHKSLPYPLKKQNGKIKYECNICSKTFGQLSNLKVAPPPPELLLLCQKLT